jgi:hypothetical protein
LDLEDVGGNGKQAKEDDQNVLLFYSGLHIEV